MRNTERKDSVRCCVCAGLRRDFAKCIGGGIADTAFRIGKKSGDSGHRSARLRFKISKPANGKITSSFGVVFEYPSQCGNDSFGFNMQVAEGVGCALTIEMVRVFQVPKEDGDRWCRVGAKFNDG